MVADGKADAVCFTPFNKQAMRMAEPTYDDEILFTSNVLGFKGPRPSSTCSRGCGTRASRRIFR